MTNQAYYAQPAVPGAFLEVHPDVYQTNIFRLLELPSFASAQDISRRRQLIERAVKTELEVPEGIGRAFPIPFDIDALNEMVHKLQDPEYRLFQEFFWFWPDKENDASLKALSQGEHEQAKTIWLANKNISGVATHNLAVMTHLIALDLEKADITQKEITDRERSWQEALANWQALQSDDRFWDLFLDRIKELEDPRLTLGTSQRVRDALPQIILSINAQLAVQSIDDRNQQIYTFGPNFEKVQITPKTNSPNFDRHIRLIGESSFSDQSKKESIYAAAEPVRRRIKPIVDMAAQEARSKTDQTINVSQRLHQQMGHFFNVLDALLPAGDPIRDTAHDEVANFTSQMAIEYVNKTQNWQAGVELLTLAKAATPSSRVLEEISKNLKIAVDNAKNAELTQVCWFCKTNPADKYSISQAPIYGNVNRQRSYNTTRVTYQHGTIPVPRCPACASQHNQIKSISQVITVIAIIAAIGCFLLASSSSKNSRGSGDFLIVTAIVAGVLAFTNRYILEMLLLRKTRREHYGYQHPFAKEMLNKGWKPGKRPTR